MADYLCPKCRQQTAIRHVHNAAHGIPGTHMAGSERFQCYACGYILTRKEAEEIGLVYILDLS